MSVTRIYFDYFSNYGPIILLSLTIISNFTIFCGTLYYNEICENFNIFNKFAFIFGNYFYRAMILNQSIVAVVISLLGLWGISTERPLLLAPYIIIRIFLDIFIVMWFFPFCISKFLEQEKYYINYFTEFENVRLYVEMTFIRLFIISLTIEFAFIAIELYYLKIFLNCFKITRQYSTNTENEAFILSRSSTSRYNRKYS